jgi:transposase-like protein
MPPKLEQVECPHCHEKQGVTIEIPVGLSRAEHQKVKCVRCEVEFPVKLDGKIVGKPSAM